MQSPISIMFEVQWTALLIWVH